MLLPLGFNLYRVIHVWYNLTFKFYSFLKFPLKSFFFLYINFIKFLNLSFLENLLCYYHVWNISTYPTVYWFMFAIKNFEVSTHSVKYKFGV